VKTAHPDEKSVYMFRKLRKRWALSDSYQVGCRLPEIKALTFGPP
jgi:hypothetical protein